ncbi:hypothetical protein, partial [Anaerobiospirillum succiniciproducens]|uniref:hypothetical protein n=1 Tax=Anaerobiospirillum succiniciproducens TaxID=13335 RepID=UPI0023556559
MKQTNNAIKFLMAQYRAIFKNANIAMVAAMVASALAAGQAQAALTFGTSADAATPSATVSGAETLDGKGSYINELIIANKGNVTFDGSSGGTSFHIAVSDTLSVLSGGSLTLKGKVGTSNDGAGWGVTGTFVTDDFSNANSTLNVDGGSVNVVGSQIQMSNVILNNAKVTLETNFADGNGKNSDFADNSQINAVVNNTGAGLFTVSGKDTDIKLNTGSILNAKTFNLDGGKITMTSTPTEGEAAIIRAYGGGVVNLNGVDITTAGSGNYIGAEGGINMKSGSITIADQSVLHLTGKLDKEKNLA